MEQSIVLYDLNWQAYKLFAQALDGNRVRMTYFAGNLELRKLSFRHANLSELVGLLVRIACFELRLEHVGGGSMTIMHEDLEIGLEPDKCFWLQNYAKVLGGRELDFRTDPVPDLIIEIEAPKSDVRRMEAFAALGVKEVWRFDGQQMFVHSLRRGKYVASPLSRCIAGLPVPESAGIIASSNRFDDLTIHHRLQDWVRTWRSQRTRSKETP